MKQKYQKIEAIIKAWELASQVHFGQKYASAKAHQEREYLNHIGRVVLEIQQAIRQEMTEQADLAIICAILHDTIEDTSITYEDIKKQFGAAVADGVLALTKNNELGDKKTQMTDSLTRIKQQPKTIWMVKMADRICNLQAPPHYWNKEKIQRYKIEATLIYETLKDGSVYLAERLREKIEGYESQ